MVYIPTAMEGKQIVGEALHPMEWMSSGFIRVASDVTYKPSTGATKELATPAQRGPAPQPVPTPAYQQYRGAPGWEEVQQEGKTIIRRLPESFWSFKDIKDPSELKYGQYSPQEYVIGPDKSYTERIYGLYQPLHSRHRVQEPYLQKEVVYGVSGLPEAEKTWTSQQTHGGYNKQFAVVPLSTKTFEQGQPVMQETFPTYTMKSYPKMATKQILAPAGGVPGALLQPTEKTITKQIEGSYKKATTPGSVTYFERQPQAAMAQQAPQQLFRPVTLRTDLLAPPQLTAPIASIFPTSKKRRTWI